MSNFKSKQTIKSTFPRIKSFMNQCSSLLSTENFNNNSRPPLLPLLQQPQLQPTFQLPPDVSSQYSPKPLLDFNSNYYKSPNKRSFDEMSGEEGQSPMVITPAKIQKTPPSTNTAPVVMKSSIRQTNPSEKARFARINHFITQIVLENKNTASTGPPRLHLAASSALEAIKTYEDNNKDPAPRTPSRQHMTNSKSLNSSIMEPRECSCEDEWLENEKKYSKSTTSTPLTSSLSSSPYTRSPSSYDQKSSGSQHQLDRNLVRYMTNKAYEWRNYAHLMVDTHCHFDMLFAKLNFKGTINEYFSKYEKLYLDNFNSCITVICDPIRYDTKASLETQLDILKHTSIYGTIGCHPHFANNWTDAIGRLIYSSLTNAKIVAIGECGIDLSHKNKVNKPQQINVFLAQLQIARETGMPIVIHCRDADEEVYNILCESLDSNHRIHLHCFTGGWQCGKKFLDKFPNLCIGVTPLITFNYSSPAYDLVKNIPIDRLLFETDAPYFVPRLKDFPSDSVYQSHPAFIFSVYERVSQIRNIKIDQLLLSNRKNVRKVYGF